MTVAVVIPAYNEAATIAGIVRRARRQVETVIVVDDGSGDDTAAQAEAAGAQLLRQPANQGKGASLWRGMGYAVAQGADAVITLDADGQHCPEDMPKLLAASPALARTADHRRPAGAPRACAPVAAFRQRHGRFLGFLGGRLCPIPDTQSGFRLYPAEFLRASDPRPAKGGAVSPSRARC
jgi:glycosyltransferase involved in cell wall biosynthesis